MLKYLTVIILSVTSLSCLAHPSSSFHLNDEQSIALSGEWNLVIDSFLTYDEIKTIEDYIDIKIPGVWNNSIWKGEKIGSEAYGTYFTRIILGNDIDSSLSLKVPEVGMAYRLYINENFIGNVGLPGTSQENTYPKTNQTIFDFDAVPNDTLTIFFHVSNFQHPSGGIWYVPTLGNTETIRRNAQINKTIILLILGALILAGMFQLIIYFVRPKEKTSLYFFLIVGSLTMLTITKGDMTILELFPNLNWKIVKKITYASIFILGSANILFLKSIYPKYFNQKVVFTSTLLGLALVLFNLITPPSITYWIITYYYAIIVVLGIYMVHRLIIAMRQNVFGTNLLLTGYFVAFIAAIHDILVDKYIIEGLSFKLLPAGMVIYLVQMSLVLGKKFIKALSEKEILSNELKEINIELEEVIHLRTSSIIEKNKLIENKNKELERTIRENSNLMSIVAHDLKAPLVSILGVCKLLNEELTGKMSTLTKMIQKISKDGLELIENMTELSSYERESFNFRYELIDLSDFFTEKVFAYEQLSSNKNIELIGNCKIANPQFITNENLLSRIVDNLLSNAIKFSPQGLKVYFDMQMIKDELCITIKDEGPGFSKKDLDLAFQKFQKLSARPTNNESSTGMGLSIVKALVENLKGAVELISSKNNGATFIITIPAGEI